VNPVVLGRSLPCLTTSSFLWPLVCGGGGLPPPYFILQNVNLCFINIIRINQKVSKNLPIAILVFMTLGTTFCGNFHFGRMFVLYNNEIKSYIMLIAEPQIEVWASRPCHDWQRAPSCTGVPVLGIRGCGCKGGSSTAIILKQGTQFININHSWGLFFNHSRETIVFRVWSLFQPFMSSTQHHWTVDQQCKDPIDTSKIRQSALRQMAGNGMSLPCAGFTLLMAVLFVEDK
jgi:hypothetical protein